jgi:DNA invertase Pin-like site-specific DNA recombinase
MSKQKITILYARLSRDDEQQGTSNSILNQQQQLEEYAKANKLTPYIFLSDDGYSGTNWNRPAWQELMAKVDADEVGCICIKDSSRMGRDYLRVGLYREMFREKGVRLIAINDNVDTQKGDDDFTPFREIMAEWYARDTSKKIKSVLHAKAKSGKPTSNTPPYGYMKDPADKYKWIIDEPAAEVVRRIFQLAMDGLGVFQIGRVLTEEKVERPAYYAGKNGKGPRRNDYQNASPYLWNNSTIAKILRTLEYCGHLANLKTETTDFKSGAFVEKPQEEWLIFENHHPAIIEQEVFDTVQKLRETVRRIDKVGVANPLTGLLWCADCGAKMYNYRRAKPRKPTEARVIDVYHCSTYKLGKGKYDERCTVHHISTETARDIILDLLRRTIVYVRTREQEFLERLRETSAHNQGETIKAHRKQIAKNEKRLAELNRIFNALYEDKALGKITDERFSEMTANYDTEQDELRAQTATLQIEIDELQSESDKTEKFLSLIRKHTHFEELTNAMLNEFVDKVIVHEGEWPEGINPINKRPMGTRSQQVDVYLKYIGKFDVPDLRTPEEIEQEEETALALEQKRKHQREYMRKRKIEKTA